MVKWSLPALVSLELGLALVERTQLLRQLVGELGEPLLACADELELPLDERNRRLDDPRALVVACALGPLVAQGGAGLFGLGERDELLEREPEQVAEPDQLLQTRDVGLGVEPVCALRACRDRSRSPSSS